MIDLNTWDKQKVGASSNGTLLKSDIFPRSSAVPIARRLDIKSAFFVACVNNTLQIIKTLVLLWFNDSLFHRSVAIERRAPLPKIYIDRIIFQVR